MNRNIPFCVIMLVLFVLTGCTGSDNDATLGEVTMATDSLVETGSFKKSNGELCEMKVTLVVSYPQALNDSTKLQQL